MMRGLSALAVKRGRPLPLNDTSYTSEDLETGPESPDLEMELRQ